MTTQPNRLLASIRRIATTALVVVAILYVVLLVVLYTFQRDMIFPGQNTQGLASSKLTPIAGETLVHLTAAGTKVTGLYGKALTPARTIDPRAERCVTVIFFVGNGSCAADCLDIFESMRRQDANVLIVDYPGYGMSGGRPSDTAAYAAADAAYRYVASRPGGDPSRIVAAGWSLGSSVATHLASTRPVAGLAIWSAFTSMAEMSHHQYPMVPTWLIRILLKYPFPTEREIHHVRAPIFMAHGTIDPFVPISMPRRLAKAAGGPVTWVPVPGARHNDIFEVGGKRLIERFGQWLGALPARSGLPALPARLRLAALPMREGVRTPPPRRLGTSPKRVGRAGRGPNVTDDCT